MRLAPGACPIKTCSCQIPATPTRWPWRRGALGYIGSMYEVLAYVYETYWGGEDCPGREQLGRRLSSAGFEREEIVAALTWLDGLNSAAQSLGSTPLVADQADAASTAASPAAMRVYTDRELAHLGAEGVACLHFLERSGALPMALRELVIDRALAVAESPLESDELRVIVMMVFWRTGFTPDALILDELCDTPTARVMH